MDSVSSIVLKSAEDCSVCYEDTGFHDICGQDQACYRGNARSCGSICRVGLPNAELVNRERPGA